MTALAIILAVTTLAALADNLALRQRIRKHTAPEPNPYDWLHNWTVDDDDDGIDWVAALDAYDARHRHPANPPDTTDIPTLEQLLAMWNDPDTTDGTP